MLQADLIVEAFFVDQSGLLVGNSTKKAE